MKFSTTFSFLLIVFLFSATASAQNVDFSIHENYISTRAKGMGGAFAAVADDYSAMFYNPAALARLTEGNLHMFLRAAIDTNYFDLADELDKANDAADKETAIAEVLTNNYGKNYYSRVPRWAPCGCDQIGELQLFPLI